MSTDTDTATDDDAQPFSDIEDVEAAEPTQNGQHATEPLTVEPPEFNSRLGAIGNAIRQYRHNKAKKKKAASGYVQWYLIDDGWPKPKFIKPKRKGAGVREYEHDGELYLFPREAFLTDKRTGSWTVVHRKGELDPIALQEPRKNALDADSAKEWAELKVTSSPPGFLEGLDLSSKELMTYLIFGIVALAVGQQVLGGGF